MVKRRIATLAGCLLLAAAGGCAAPSDSAGAESAPSPEPAVTVHGRLSYPERVALPPDTVVVVEVTAGDRLLAAEHIALEGRQVPVAFSLDVPGMAADSPQLQAGALSPAGAARLTEPVALSDVSGDESVDLGTLRLQSHRRVAFGTPMRCGAKPVVFGHLGGEAVLLAEGRGFFLEQRRAASGARYRAGPDTEFWSKGERARVTVDGRELDECIPVTALLSETRWRLEALDGSAIAGNPATLEFDAGNGLGGRGFCNHYSGRWEPTGAGLRLTGPVTSTLMACAEERMNAEARLFELLDDVWEFEIDGDRLVLRSDGGRTLEARRMERD